MHKSTFLISTAVGLTTICNPALSRPHQSPSIDFAKAPHDFKRAKQTPGKGDHLYPWKTFLTWGATTMTLPGGLVAEDTPFQVNCKKSCSVFTRNTAEVLSYYSYNQVGICPVVDGYFTNGSCYFSGTVNPSDLYANRTNQTNYSPSSFDKHTFQTYLYTVAPAYLGHYQNEYEVWLFP